MKSKWSKTKNRNAKSNIHLIGVHVLSTPLVSTESCNHLFEVAKKIWLSGKEYMNTLTSSVWYPCLRHKPTKRIEPGEPSNWLHRLSQLEVEIKSHIWIQAKTDQRSGLRPPESAPAPPAEEEGVSAHMNMHKVTSTSTGILTRQQAWGPAWSDITITTSVNEHSDVPHDNAEVTTHPVTWSRIWVSEQDLKLTHAVNAHVSTLKHDVN